MKQITSTISLLIIALVSSCNQEEINWNFNNDPSDLLVVEAVITNEKKQHTIKLSKPYQEQNLSAEPVSGATVTLSTTTDVYITTETPIGSGLYLTDSLRAVSGKEYTLSIQYNNNTYFASDIQPPVEAMGILSYRSTADSLYTLNFYNTGKEPNYISYNIDWTATDICLTPSECRALQFYYDLKNFDINKQFAPDQEQVNFPAGTTIIRKKFSVSEDYQAYLRGMLSETAWRGGIFDVYPANAPTNLSEGAVGFFAVSTVVSDTTIVK